MTLFSVCFRYIESETLFYECGIHCHLFSFLLCLPSPLVRTDWDRAQAELAFTVTRARLEADLTLAAARLGLMLLWRSWGCGRGAGASPRDGRRELPHSFQFSN